MLLAALAASMAAVPPPGPAGARTFPLPGSGSAAALGAASVALPTWSASGDANPAFLGQLDHAQAGVEFGMDPDAPGPARLLLALPTWDHLGFAVQTSRARFDAALAERDRAEWRAGAGRAWGGRFMAGAALGMRRESIAGQTDTSNGLDLGAHARIREHGALVFDAGAVVRGLIRPEVRFDGATFRDPRILDAGLGATRQWNNGWRTGLAVAISTSSSTPGAGWLAGRIVWHDRVEWTSGVSGHAQRAGAAVRWQALRVEAFAARGDGARSGLALHWEFGPSLAAERLAAQARADALLSERMGREIAARQARQIEAWLDDAGAALARRDHPRAVELYRNVLLWNPEHAEARDGLRRAQRGAMLHTADSLLADRDLWNAGSQLESVLRLFPEDSLATARLQEVQKSLRRADKSRSQALEQLRLGLDAYAAQRYPAAIRCFEQARKLDAQNTVAGEFLEHARAALDKLTGANLASARAHFERRELEVARTEIKAVLSQVPGHPEAKQLLALCDRETERVAQERKMQDRRDRRLAVARREDAAREDRAPAPPPAALAAGYDRGLQMYRAGDMLAAMNAWEEIARQAPHFQDVDQYLLRVYRVAGLESYTEGRLQDAIDIWGKALRLEPSNDQVRRYLNQANAKMKRSQEPRGVR